MPKRNSKEKRPKDDNQLAAEIVRIATAEGEEGKSLISKIMAEMGRKGGRIGGKKRLETMTPDERSRIAFEAAKARWAKRKNKNKGD
jgi:hypothetical protein